MIQYNIETERAKTKGIAGMPIVAREKKLYKKNKCNNYEGGYNNFYMRKDSIL